MPRLVTAAVVALLVLGACRSGGDGASAPQTTVGGGTAPAGYCDAQAQNRELNDLLAELSERPELIDQTLATASANLERSVERAPEEIRTEMRTFADAYRPVLRELQENENFLDIDPNVFNALGRIEVVRALERVREYYERVCS